MFSYPAKPSRSFGLWAIGAAGIAACVAVGIGLLIFAPGRIGLAIPESSAAWGSIRNVAASVRSFIAVKSGSMPSSLNVQAAELPSDGSEQASLPANDAETKVVVVQPGETLRQIIYRTGGEYDNDSIEQFEKLNPARLRLWPPRSRPVDSTAASLWRRMIQQLLVRETAYDWKELKK